MVLSITGYTIAYMVWRAVNVLKSGRSPESPYPLRYLQWERSIFYMQCMRRGTKLSCQRESYSAVIRGVGSELQPTQSALYFAGRHGSPAQSPSTSNFCCRTIRAPTDASMNGGEDVSLRSMHAFIHVRQLQRSR